MQRSEGRDKMRNKLWTVFAAGGSAIAFAACNSAPHLPSAAKDVALAPMAAPARNLTRLHEVPVSGAYALVAEKRLVLAYAGEDGPCGMLASVTQHRVGMQVQVKVVIGQPADVNHCGGSGTRALIALPLSGGTPLSALDLSSHQSFVVRAYR